MRMKTVRMKLNTIRSEFRGKNVLLVDDSIVRGTTSRELVSMAREAGARKVYVTSAAPPVRWPNVYGIDIPTKTELIAYERDEAQVGGWVFYVVVWRCVAYSFLPIACYMLAPVLFLPLSRRTKATRSTNPAITHNHPGGRGAGGGLGGVPGSGRLEGVRPPRQPRHPGL